MQFIAKAFKSITIINQNLAGVHWDKHNFQFKTEVGIKSTPIFVKTEILYCHELGFKIYDSNHHNDNTESFVEVNSN